MISELRCHGMKGQMGRFGWRCDWQRFADGTVYP